MSRAVHKFEATVKEVDVRLSVSGGDAGKGPRVQKTELTVYTLRNGVVRAYYAHSTHSCALGTRVCWQLRNRTETALVHAKPACMHCMSNSTHCLPVQMSGLLNHCHLAEQPPALHVGD